MYEKFINSHDYIKYLEYLKIDLRELKKEIQYRVNQQEKLFNLYWNNSYKLSSPNINLENIIFEEANRFIFKYYKDEFQFDISLKLDLKTLIATNHSLVERPSIKKLSHIKQGLKVGLESENEFLRIAKFENELILGDYTDRQKKQLIIFEGLTPLKNKNPFFEYIPSLFIWDNKFYFYKEERFIGFCKNFNGIEAKYVLWINSYLLELLELELDDFNNGLQAINKKGEVVLKFRQWRSKLIGNGASFIGQDANIAQFEGCDLILRKDYFEKLKMMIPDMRFYTEKMELKL